MENWTECCATINRWLAQGNEIVEAECLCTAPTDEMPPLPGEAWIMHSWTGRRTMEIKLVLRDPSAEQQHHDAMAERMAAGVWQR